MMSSYHRRILMHPEDVEAVALVKIGSGGNSSRILHVPRRRESRG